MLPLNLIAATCTGDKLFNLFPTWYEFLPCKDNGMGACVSPCTPALEHLTDVWLVVAAIIEILLRLASLAAIAFIIYGGILYTTSQGSPDQTKQARSTIINALIGLLIALTASVLVAFIAGQFKAQ